MRDYACLGLCVEGFSLNPGYEAILQVSVICVDPETCRRDVPQRNVERVFPKYQLTMYFLIKSGVKKHLAIHKRSRASSSKVTYDEGFTERCLLGSRKFCSQRPTVLVLRAK